MAHATPFLRRYRPARVLVLAVLLPACSSENDEEENDQKEFDARLPRLGIAACAHADGVLVIQRDTQGGQALTSVGTVVEVAARTPDIEHYDFCPRQGRLTVGRASALFEVYPETTWLRIAPLQGPEVLLSVTAPGFAPQLQPGDVVRVDARTEGNTFAANRDWFELRDEARRLLFWYGSAASVAEFRLPAEVQLSEGETQARHGDRCIPRWDEKRIDVAVDGATASVGVGDQTAVGGWLVSNTGVAVQLGPSHCPDAFATTASAALWTLTP